MIARFFFHRSIATGLLSGVQLIAIAITLSTLAGPGRADTGQWTPDSVNWSEGNVERYAVHMMLLRGDNKPYHSRILWFQGEDLSLNTLYGGEWGWTPGNDGCTSLPKLPFRSPRRESFRHERILRGACDARWENAPCRWR